MAASSRPWLKPAVFVGALVPLAAVLLRAVRGELGANPIAEALNRFGLVALVFLLLTLACTPLKLLLRWTWPAVVRRMLGLFTFFYATLHFSTYLFLDQALAFAAVVRDVTKRPFVMVGFMAWLLLVPLAVTSTKAMVQRLGFRPWKALHRFVYGIALLAILHFVLRVKKDASLPFVYGGVLLLLLAVRAIDALKRRRATTRAA